MKPKQLIGKTIKSINAKACNVWHIEFTDGTKTSLTYEFVAPNLCGLVLEKSWE